MTRDGDSVERAVTALRAPVDIGSGFDARVMEEVRRGPHPVRVGRLRRLGTWMLEPHPIRVRPVLLAAALAIAAVGIFARTASRPAGTAPLGGPQEVRFVLIAPDAERVDLVGDFNDWTNGATPMRTANGGIWTVTVPLAPGRYRYAFLVDGTEWTPDPGAPRALEDDFGRPNSVLTLGGT